MWLKLIGITILVISALYVGLLLVCEKQRVLRAVRFVCLLYQHAADRIAVQLVSVTEMFSGFTSEFKHLDDAVRRGNWQIVRSELGAEQDLLRDFPEILGTLYRDEAERLCRLATDAADRRYKKLLDEYERKKRMYLTMPLFAAISGLLLVL